MEREIIKYLEDFGNNANSADSHFLSLKAKVSAIRQHCHRRFYCCIIIERLPLQGQSILTHSHYSGNFQRLHTSSLEIVQLQSQIASSRRQGAPNQEGGATMPINTTFLKGACCSACTACSMISPAVRSATSPIVPASYNLFTACYASRALWRSSHCK